MASSLLPSLMGLSLEDWLQGNDGSCCPATVKERVLALACSAIRDVPAFASICPSPPANFPHFSSSAPFLDKTNFINAFPMTARCRHSNLSALETLHASSGSSGQPTFWGRTAEDEIMTSVRFEQVFHDNFDAASVRTLAVIAFPLGSWVGGVFTYNCLRYLTQKQYLVTQVTPGNNMDEILKVVRMLAPSFQQTIILGYPPFVKGVIDKGLGLGMPWAAFNLGFVFAGEVFSEEFRLLVAQRAGLAPDRALQRVVSIYGTADAGVLGVETPLSASMRQWLSGHPEVMHELFGGDRIPSLFQYDPLHRYFEVHPHDKTLAFSSLPAVAQRRSVDDGCEDVRWSAALEAACDRMVMPAIRYAIGDAGGLLSFDDMMGLLASKGFTPSSPLPLQRRLPFVWVFGRAHWTLSLYGANVYVENIMPGLEKAGIAELVTGKFILALNDDLDDCRLLIRVELSPSFEARAAGAAAVGEEGEGTQAQRPEETGASRQAAGAGCGDIVDAVARSILEELLRLNSEYGCYVPRENQMPRVLVYPFGDPQYFPQGVKHRYI